MVQSLPPSTLRRILGEMRELTTRPREGVRLCAETLDDGDLDDVRAWVEGPQGTPFDGGFFKIRFAFGPEYPAVPPNCTFITKIFHPNVNPTTGEICVNTLKKDWKSEFGISHILLVVKCLLIHPNPNSALHAEAGRLLHDAFDDYATRARLMTSIHATPRTRPTEFGPPPSLPTDALIPAPLQPSTFSNTASASPAPEKPTSPGKTRGASNVSLGGEPVEVAPAPMIVEKPTVKKVAGVAKKRGLRRL